MTCSFCGNTCIRNYDSAFEDTGTGIWWECIECGSMFEGGKYENNNKQSYKRKSGRACERMEKPIPIIYDKNGQGIYSGDKVKGLFLYGCDIIGKCAYSSKDAAWGIRWMRGEVEEFTPFCACCNVEWEVVGE